MDQKLIPIYANRDSWMLLTALVSNGMASLANDARAFEEGSEEYTAGIEIQGRVMVMLKAISDAADLGWSSPEDILDTQTARFSSND